MGVEVFDKDKMWKSKNGLSGIVIGYRSGGNGDKQPGGPTDVEISTIVQQREKARHQSDWTTADMIRDELKQWGVEIYDKDKIWKCSDGRNGMVPSWDQVSAGPAPGPQPPAGGPAG